MAWPTRSPPRVIAAVVAFSGGVPISALGFEPMDEVHRTGGSVATAADFPGGAAVYTASGVSLDRRGGLR